MDKLENYNQIARKIVLEHARYASKREGIETLTLCDHSSGNYLLMRVGWHDLDRTHSILFHLRILEGKIWIEQDGIEYGIAQDLLDAGVPKEDIVLAFYDPKTRQLTDFAVA